MSHTTGGNRWLRGTLTECAWAAAAKKNCFIKDKFWRITSKSGGKKAPAIVAIAHTLLSLIYQALGTGAQAECAGQGRRRDSYCAQALDSKRHHLNTGVGVPPANVSNCEHFAVTAMRVQCGELPFNYSPEHGHDWTKVFGLPLCVDRTP